MQLMLKCSMVFCLFGQFLQHKTVAHTESYVFVSSVAMFCLFFYANCESQPRQGVASVSANQLGEFTKISSSKPCYIRDE